MEHQDTGLDQPDSLGDEPPDGFQELRFDRDSTESTDPFMETFKALPEVPEPGGQRHNPFLRIAYGRKLLDYEQERELGRRLGDARRDMTEALSAFVPAIEHLCTQWERAVVNERSPGEVLQWPGGSASASEGAAKGGCSASRKHMATLSLQLSLWLREHAGVDALDAPLRAGEDTTYLDLATDEAQPETQERVQHGEVSDIVERELQGLPRREATILRLRLGLGGAEARTLEEIGAILGITRERTRQLQNRALATLRERLKDDRHALI